MAVTTRFTDCVCLAEPQRLHNDGCQLGRVWSWRISTHGTKSGSLTESHYTINSFGIAGDSPSPSGIPPHLKLKTHTCIHSQHDCHSICKQMGHLVEPAKSRSHIFLWMDWEKHFVTLSRISKGSWMPVIVSAAKARSRGNCVLIVSPPEVFNPIAQTFGKLTWKLLGI